MFSDLNLGARAYGSCEPRSRAYGSGMSPEKRKKPGNVSERQFAMQVGNAMSVNVVERILTRLLPAAGLTGPLEDRWASGAARRELALTRE